MTRNRRAARALLPLIAILAGCEGQALRASNSPTPASNRPALTSEQLAVIEVGRNATQVALGRGRAYVGNSGDGTLSVIDASANRLQETFRVGDTGVLRGRGCAPGTVHSAPDGSYAVRECDLPSAVLFAADSLWVTRDDEQALLRMDPVTHRVLDRVPLGISPFLMAAGGGSIWITDYVHDQLARVDIASRTVIKVFTGLPHGPSGVSFGAGAAWVANRREGALTRIDATSNQVTAVIPMGRGGGIVGSSPLAVVAGDAAVFVKNEYDQDVTRVDPATNKVVAVVAVGPKEGRDGVDSLALEGPYLWVTGMHLQKIDTRTNQVVGTLAQDASTVTVGGDGTLWVTEIGGRVVRVKAA
jgi:DNA-binding beta-propeller fold protein YncE